MRTFLLAGGLFLIASATLFAQSRVSIAPTYWFNYNPYAYQFTYSYNGSTTQTSGSGYGMVSSFGLTARYHFTSRWDASVGGLYYRNTNHIKSPQGPYGEFRPFTSEGWQLPIFVSYRLTDKSLSPYFSAGAVFTDSKTFIGRPITTDAIIGMGLSYRINSEISLLLQPTAGYSFYRPANDAFYTYSQYSSYSFGIQSQFIWHFLSK